jgi:hypothetical protein
MRAVLESLGEKLVNEPGHRDAPGFSLVVENPNDLPADGRGVVRESHAIWWVSPPEEFPPGSSQRDRSILYNAGGGGVAGTISELSQGDY